MAKNQVAENPQAQTQTQPESERSLARRNYYYPYSSGSFFSLSPFAMLREMTDWMDRAIGGGLQGSRGRDGAAWSPTVEVREKDNNLIVCADLPGIEPKDVTVEVEDGSLVIRGERRREHTEQREGFHRTERSYGSFYRSIPLPENAKLDDAKADFRNGVLEIKVPVEQAKSNRKSIPIESGSWSGGTSGATGGRIAGSEPHG